MHIHLFQGSGELLRPEVGEVLLNGTNATFYQFSRSFHFPGKKCGLVCNVQKERWGQYGWSKTLLHKAIVHILNTHIHTHKILLKY